MQKTFYQIKTIMLKKKALKKIELKDEYSCQF